MLTRRVTYLHQQEDTHSTHMLTRLNMLKPNEPNLHGKQHPQDIHTVIRNVQPHGIPSSDQHHKDVKRNQVNNKDISSPSRNHVKVTKRRAKSPRQRPRLHRLNKEVKRQQKRENRHRLVVIRSSNGPRDVSRAYRDESSGDEPSPRVPNLFTEEVRDDGGVGGEERRRQDADLADVDEEAEEPQRPVDQSGGYHETGVKRAADDPTERVPGLGIEPVPELVEAFLREEERGSVVEIGIELVDHGFVAEDAEEASDEG